MNKKENFENIIKKKLEGYQPQPPADLWDRLEYRLENNKNLGWKQYVRYAAAFLLLIASAWGGYEFIYKNAVHEEVAYEAEHFAKPESLDPITLSESIRPEIHKKPARQVPEKTAPIYEDDPDLLIAEEDIEGIEKEDFYIKEKQQNDTITEPADEPLQQIDFIEPTYADYQKIEVGEVSIHRDEPSIDDMLASVELVGDGVFDDHAEYTSPWTLYVNASPQYAFRINSSNPKDLVGAKTILEQNENHLITYNLGLNFKYSLNERIEMESGLSYVRMGQSIRNIRVYNDRQRRPLFGDGSLDFGHPQSVITSMGEISFNDPTLYFDDVHSDRVKMRRGYDDPDNFELREKGDRLNQHLGFIEIPVVLRYNLYDRQTKIQLKGGVGFNYLVTNSVVLKQDGIRNSIGKTALVRNWNVSVSGGVAFLVPVSNNINFHLEPTANMFVTSMTQGKEYNVFPFGLSLSTGISMPL